MLAVVARWGLRGAVVGEITADGDVVVVQRGAEIARIPARALAIDVPSRSTSRRRPLDAGSRPRRARRPLPTTACPSGAWIPARCSSRSLGHPNLGSRAWVTTQYDQTVGTDTIEGCAHGAAVLRVKGTRRALVIATDSQPSVAHYDPALGAAQAVAECARNVSLTGARPLGLTNCLNFGDPNNPEAYWQLAESVRGLSEAALALDLPVTGGNVSLYNESPLGRIAPTAQIGVVGVLDDIDDLVRPEFVAEGDVVVLLGETGPGMAGSAYERLAGAAPDEQPPSLDLAREAALQELLRVAAADRVLKSAQDVSAGGLAVALAECAIWSGLGAQLALPVAARAGRRRSSARAPVGRS